MAGMEQISHGAGNAAQTTAFSLFNSLARGKLRPDARWDSPRWRTKFTARALLQPLQTRQWFRWLANFPETSLLENAGQRHFCKLQRPYLHAASRPRQTRQALIQHFSFIQQLPKVWQDRLYSAQPDGTEIAQFAGKAQHYSLRLVCQHTMDKEGELSLQLSTEGVLLTQATFSIIQRDNQWCLFIGGLQGPRTHTPHEVIQRATRDCHSLFPKRILLEGLLALSRQLGIEQVVSVSNETHIYKHWRYRRKKRGVFLADYNSFLLSLGGVVQADKNIALPMSIARKAEADIPSRKRAEYRRRYGLLDCLNP
ncbi:hypothetical protein CIG19_06285 [Enterobacterales bacterium CwR94]|nr:hypothetical protein CIG19_06285 [Enterobacterales bacterium CwR94]